MLGSAFLQRKYGRAALLLDTVPIISESSVTYCSLRAGAPGERVGVRVELRNRDRDASLRRASVHRPCVAAMNNASEKEGRIEAGNEHELDTGATIDWHVPYSH